jgi:hypothetical protein
MAMTVGTQILTDFPHCYMSKILKNSPILVLVISWQLHDVCYKLTFLSRH